MWRNGRRARFRSVCPKGRGGSTPPIPTRSPGRPLSAERADRGRSAYLLRGPSPRTPRVAVGALSASVAGGRVGRFAFVRRVGRFASLLLWSAGGLGGLRPWVPAFACGCLG